MSLAHKLHKIGKLVSKEDIKNIIETKKDDIKDISNYKTIMVDFIFENDNLIRVNQKEASLDNLNVMFTKKIGGTSNSYYLYPNFEFQKEANLYKKFKASAYTLSNSILNYSDENNQLKANVILEYLNSYKDDILGFKKYQKGDYFLIFTINNQSFYDLMPEVWENYYNNFVEPHISNKNKPLLKEEIDCITYKKTSCGYNPNVKFFTMDNYQDKLKPKIIDFLPMSKESAIEIKKGWMYAINHLKFYHKGLEYIVIPSMVNYDEKVYERLLNYLQKSKNIQAISSQEDSFIRRLAKQIEEFDKSLINSISLDILFTEVNLTNLSVKIFATLEDVIPSRINQVVKLMKEESIRDVLKRDESDKEGVYLRDYFSREELFAIATKNTNSMKNRILLEKIYLAKLLLGYVKIDYFNLLQRFEHHREYDFEHKKKLEDGIKKWINFPKGFIQHEDRVLNFLNNLNAIDYKGAIK